MEHQSHLSYFQCQIVVMGDNEPDLTLEYEEVTLKSCLDIHYVKRDDVHGVFGSWLDR